MTDNITPEKLEAFAMAVIDAAKEHLGKDGVISVAVGLDRNAYTGALREASILMDWQHAPHVMSYFSEFLAIVPAHEWGQFAKYLKAQVK